VAAWKRGDISAAYVWQPFLSQLIQDGGHVLVTSDEMAKKGYPVFDAVAVNSKFEKEHPDIVEGFVKAEIEGTKYYHEHPDESYALIAKSVGITKQEAEEQSKEYVFPEAKEQISHDWIGTTATKCDATVAKGLSTTASWLVSTNKIQDNSPHYCDAVQPAYVEKYVDSTK
jgi:taurine transport system substrate-binding protein